MFSIIMPAYNCETEIKKAIESVLSQTFSDFELIIIDDGSKDHTLEIAESFAQADERIRLIKAEHGGVSAARNRGILEARKENILFLDSDDTWDSCLLQCCAEHVGEEDTLLVFGIRSDYYDKAGTLASSQNRFPETGDVSLLKMDDTILQHFNRGMFFSQCDKVFKREILLKFGILFDENCVYLEDFKFNLEYLVHIRKVKVLHRNLYFYRLLLEEKQILKRNFKGLFVNADAVYASCEKLSKHNGWSFPTDSVFVPLLLKTYFCELLSHAYGKSAKEQNQILTMLNANIQYKELLQNANGKFFRLFKICKALGFKKVQLSMIKKRYW